MNREQLRTHPDSAPAPAPAPARVRWLVLLVVAAAVVASVALAVVGFTSVATSFAGMPLQSAPGAGGDPALEGYGELPDGVTLHDDVPAVSRLEAGLLAALRRADADAAGAGIEFQVTSGWRTPEYQEHLLAEAVELYGSAEEAARWVATAETSAHVSGEAVDIGGYDAAAWLDEHGAVYGLCRIYDNEPWHFELRPEAVDAGCPAMYFDPTEDPRMQP
jgi:hypothetical protein